MATRIIDDDSLNNIALAIRSMDGGGLMTVDEMPDRITAIPTGGAAEPISEKALNLWDWEGTLLFSYSREEAMALAALPDPSDSPIYKTVGHDLLRFQEWTHTLSRAKEYLEHRPYGVFDISSLYVTVDGETHRYFYNSKIQNTRFANIVKTSTTNYFAGAWREYTKLESINVAAGTAFAQGLFYSCKNLKHIAIPDFTPGFGIAVFGNCSGIRRLNIPNGILEIPTSFAAFNSNLCRIIIPETVTSIGSSAFNACECLTRIEFPAALNEIGAAAFYSCTELHDVVIKGRPNLANSNAFSGAPADQKFYAPRANLSWFQAATNWSSVYSKFAAIEDNIEYLESIGADVSNYK